MTPTVRTLTLLRAEGYVVAVAEAWVPGVNHRRDVFGFADVAGVHPHLAHPLLVQVTSTANVSSRLKKVRESVAAKVWLQAGGRIEVHGWKLVDGRWTCRRIDVRADGMLPTDLAPRPKRRRKQRGLFDGVGSPAPGEDAHADA